MVELRLEDRQRIAGLAAAAALHIALLLALLIIRPEQMAEPPELPPLEVETLPPQVPEPPEPELKLPPRPKQIDAPSGGSAGSAMPRTTPPEQMDRTFMNEAPAAPPPPAPSTLPTALNPLPPFSGIGVESGSGRGSGAGGTGTGSGAGNGSGSGVRSRPVDQPADWIRKPSVEEMRRFNPPYAAARVVSGQVLLSCFITAANVPRDCRVLDEQPRGFNFGRAAINASRIFRIRPPVRGGVPRHDERVHIPVEFQNLPR